MIAALMIQGSNPTLARDTIFSTLMITLGALLGLALLIGGFRFREQQINFKGVNSFMELIFPLAILTLVMPNFTRTGGDGAYSPLHALCLTVLSLTIYGVFLGVQTSLHRGFFEEYEDEGGTAKKPASFQKTEAFPSASVPLLFLYLLPILLLSEHFGRILNYGMHGGGLPLEFGGLIVALLLMAPEGLAAIEAATHNKLQRSMNILFGSVLSTIGLTAPVALAIGLLLHKPVELGLSAPSMILLGTMLGNCLITFVSGRTNILQGFVHLLLFAAYIVLMFD
jgi:Ca2+:H+ antiporter